jgi:hypothetical protein
LNRLFRAVVTAAVVVGVSAWAGDASAQTNPPPPSATATPDNAILMTIFLRHDESRPLAELSAT